VIYRTQGKKRSERKAASELMLVYLAKMRTRLIDLEVIHGSKLSDAEQRYKNHASQWWHEVSAIRRVVAAGSRGKGMEDSTHAASTPAWLLPSLPHREVGKQAPSVVASVDHHARGGQNERSRP
jgi:hypothetical protein